MIHTYKSSRRGHFDIMSSLPYVEKQVENWLQQHGFMNMAHLNLWIVVQLKFINSMDGSYFLEPDESNYQGQFTKIKWIKNDHY